MVIRWNESAAEEILRLLSHAEEAMHSCRMHIAETESSFLRANPDRDIEALTILSRRFEETIGEWKKIEADIEESEIAIRKTEDRFTELEESLCARAERIISVSAPETFSAISSSRYVQWDSAQVFSSSVILTGMPIADSFMNVISQGNSVNYIPIDK